MKRNFKLIVLIFLVSILAMGCRQASIQEEKNENFQKDETQKEENRKEGAQGKTPANKEETTDEGSEIKDPEDNAVPLKVLLYSPNEEGDGFETKEIEMSELSAEFLISSLSEKGVIPSEVKVLSFRVAQDEEDKAIELDLNKTFGDFLQSIGSTGEYLAMGSVCNTFLDAYNCPKIQITVEGKVLTTGHAEYPGYMSKFE